MDRDWTTPTESRGTWRRSPADEFILPTRSAAKAAIRSALLAQTGPVLLTGEPGTGKSWLCRQLMEELPARWHSLSVDLTPADGPADFHKLVGYELGLSGPKDLGTTRLSITDYLHEAAANGDRWLLVVDEAQNLSPAVMEEIRVLANRLGTADGFAGLLLSGHTSLRRRLTVRPLHAIESRLTARLHLRPLDIDEARGLLSHVFTDRMLDAGSLELIHRDAAGNPRALLRLAGAWAALPDDRNRLRTAAPAPAKSEVRPLAVDRVAAAAELETARPTPVLATSKPPIRVEDGLIEVGWTPTDRDAAPEQPASAEPSEGEEPAPSDGEEVVDDHYAALQAWTEWARNQGRDPSEGPEFGTAEHETAEHAESVAEVAHGSGHPSVWAEGQHSFAPYSQLFSRLRQKDSR